MNKKRVFKKYEMNQPLLLPPSLEELIPKNHLVRTLNNVINKLNLDFLYDLYHGVGASSYHPEMMLKVLFYAYTQKIYSSRMIAKALRENVNFMWLSGNNQPDFRTINRFRLKLKNKIDSIFSEVLFFLNKNGFISLKNYFLDGTKIEANANKYSFVWKKSTVNYKEKLKIKVKEHLKHIEKLNAEEDSLYKGNDLEELGEDVEIDSQTLIEIVEKLNSKLSSSGNEKKKNTRKYLKK